jgi:hypothetical protein
MKQRFILIGNNLILVIGHTVGVLMYIVILIIWFQEQPTQILMDFIRIIFGSIPKVIIGMGIERPTLQPML